MKNKRLILRLLNLVTVCCFLLLQNCNNGNDYLQESNNDIKNDIIKKINRNSISYQKKIISRGYEITQTDTQKINKDKATQMGLADAIVGGLTAAASSALGPYFAPYAGLWGGFLASSAMADLYDKGHKKNSIVQPRDSSFLFLEGYLGSAHNDLLEKSIIDTNFKNILKGDSLSDEVRSLLISNNYFNTNNIEMVYLQLTPIMIKIYKEFMNCIEPDSLSFRYDLFLNSNTDISDLEKQIILTISQQIFEIETYYYTSYLLDIENLIKNDTSITNLQKSNLMKFISILNSSIKFWMIN